MMSVVQGDRLPILNSISEARLEMFDIYPEHPFLPVLLITEGMNDLWRNDA